MNIFPIILEVSCFWNVYIYSKILMMFNVNYNFFYKNSDVLRGQPGSSKGIDQIVIAQANFPFVYIMSSLCLLFFIRLILAKNYGKTITRNFKMMYIFFTAATISMQVLSIFINRQVLPFIINTIILPLLLSGLIVSTFVLIKSSVSKPGSDSIQKLYGEYIKSFIVSLFILSLMVKADRNMMLYTQHKTPYLVKLDFKSAEPVHDNTSVEPINVTLNTGRKKTLFSRRLSNIINSYSTARRTSTDISDGTSHTTVVDDSMPLDDYINDDKVRYNGTKRVSTDTKMFMCDYKRDDPQELVRRLSGVIRTLPTRHKSLTSTPRPLTPRQANALRLNRSAPKLDIISEDEIVNIASPDDSADVIDGRSAVVIPPELQQLRRAHQLHHGYHHIDENGVRVNKHGLPIFSIDIPASSGDTSDSSSGSSSPTPPTSPVLSTSGFEFDRAHSDDINELTTRIIAVDIPGGDLYQVNFNVLQSALIKRYIKFFIYYPAVALKLVYINLGYTLGLNLILTCLSIYYILKLGVSKRLISRKTTLDEIRDIVNGDSVLKMLAIVNTLFLIACMYLINEIFFTYFKIYNFTYSKLISDVLYMICKLVALIVWGSGKVDFNKLYVKILTILSIGMFIICINTHRYIYVYTKTNEIISPFILDPIINNASIFDKICIFLYKFINSVLFTSTVFTWINIALYTAIFKNIYNQFIPSYTSHKLTYKMFIVCDFYIALLLMTILRYN